MLANAKHASARNLCLQPLRERLAGVALCLRLRSAMPAVDIEGCHHTVMLRMGVNLADHTHLLQAPFQVRTVRLHLGLDAFEVCNEHVRLWRRSARPCGGPRGVGPRMQASCPGLHGCWSRRRGLGAGEGIRMQAEQRNLVDIRSTACLPCSRTDSCAIRRTAQHDRRCAASAPPLTVRSADGTGWQKANHVQTLTRPCSPPRHN